MSLPRNTCGGLLFLFSFFLLLLSVCPAHANTTDQRTIEDQYLIARGRFNRLIGGNLSDSSRDDWQKVALDFQKDYLGDPKSAYAPNCLFMLGRTYREMFIRFHNQSDLNEAVIFFNDTARLFPDNSLADDSLMAVADIYLGNLHNPKLAAKVLNRIITAFPQGDMRPQAIKQLKRLCRKNHFPLPSTLIDNTQAARLVNVLPVKYWSSNDYTRVVINASGPVTYKEDLLEKSDDKPRRLLIDFFNSYIAPRYRAPVPIEDGLLKRIRTGQYNANTVRVVLDIESISSYNIFSLADPFRVIVDVRGRPKRRFVVSRRSVPSSGPGQRPVKQPVPAATIAKSAKPPLPVANKTSEKVSRVPTKTATIPRSKTKIAEKTEPESKTVKKSPPVVKPKAQTTKPSVAKSPIVATARPEARIVKEKSTELVILRDHKKIAPADIKAKGEELVRIPQATPPGKSFSLAQQLGLGVKTIVLDPGHGGKDPGAMANGLKEKNIVLKVAKILAPMLEKRLGCRVILTRTTDVFIPLEERTAIANTHDADLFVSLHVNASPSNSANGIETYYLNLTTNPEAMRVAAYENATSTHQISDLQNILSTILKNTKINESARLAEQVHKAIIDGLKMHFPHIKDMGVRQAPFYVLIGAEMPAILVEMSFITNKNDAQHLKSNRFLTDLASDITSGIQSYVSANTASLRLSYSRN